MGALDGAGRAGALEAEGYLTHPHTSAGRVPTDSGYRRYVDLLMAVGGACRRRPRVELELSRLRREVDEAMRETTAALAQVTDLVAMATAPPPGLAATIHRVEVLRLQPTKVVVIAIASTGDVARRVFEFERAGRPRPGRVGLQLPERVAVRARRRRADDRRPPRRSRAGPGRGRVRRHPRRRLHRARARDRRRPLHGRRLAPALRGPPRRPAPRRRADDRAGAPRRRPADAALLARRALGLPLDRRREPAAGAALGQRVGANYGLGHRNLGSVGVVGPLRMDYATAIASVRGAARELSRYFETVYDD